MGRFGLTEILIIVGILVILFGAKKIPELARGMGLGIKEFKKGLAEGEQEADQPEVNKEEDKEKAES